MPHMLTIVYNNIYLFIYLWNAAVIWKTILSPQRWPLFFLDDIELKNLENGYGWDTRFGVAMNYVFNCSWSMDRSVIFQIDRLHKQVLEDIAKGYDITLNRGIQSTN